MIRYRVGLLALVAACAPLAWALPAGAQQSTVRAATIAVTAGKPSEFHFTLSKKTAALGTVTFKLTNKAIAFKKKGSYPYLCTVTGHAAAGMKGTFKIT